MAKITVVNPHHWLNEDGSFPEGTRIRNQMIRVAQCIEYGGNLRRGEYRQTLSPCRRRVGGTACPGFMMVLKQRDDAIQSFCPVCTQDEYLVYEWENTPWAKGPPVPLDVETLREAGGIGSPPKTPKTGDLKEMLARSLVLVGSTLSATEVVNVVRSCDEPNEVLRRVFGSLAGPPPTHGAMERFLPVLMEVWNQTPRAELQGRTPAQAYQDAPPRDRSGASATRQPIQNSTQPSTRASFPDVGRNQPCPCGSGKKFKRCCMSQGDIN